MPREDDWLPVFDDDIIESIPLLSVYGLDFDEWEVWFIENPIY